MDTSFHTHCWRTYRLGVRRIPESAVNVRLVLGIDKAFFKIYNEHVRGHFVVKAFCVPLF